MTPNGETLGGVGGPLSCYHPLHAWPTGCLTAAGKTEYLITGFSDPPIPPQSVIKTGYHGKPVTIPCGQCIGCRIDRSREWANRCLMELESHPEGGYFLTLTYNDMHLPWSWYADPYTGEAQPSLTLDRRDVQLFIKRLRRATGQSLRYFGCGEYGPRTMRPHYHLIIFGLVLDDLEPLPGRSSQGYTYYRSKLVEDCWSFGMRDQYRHDVSPTVYDDRGRPRKVTSTAGYVVVGAISWETCAYTARYVTKKLTGDAAQYYDYFNITPPFSMMSLKPGIGADFYRPEIYEHEHIVLSTPTGGRKFRPPKYFDRMFDIEYPEKMLEIKRDRVRKAELQKQLQLEKTDLNYMEMLAAQELSFSERVKPLKRDLL